MPVSNSVIRALEWYKRFYGVNSLAFVIMADDSVRVCQIADGVLHVLE